MEIRSLAGIASDTLFKAFSDAFADYELQLDKSQLLSMLKRRGFDPALSFAAFDGDRIVAFTFNGIGRFNGIPTAYDTGTGTLKAYRGRGLATRIFEYSIPYLKEAGVQQYLLEVLQHNTKAVSVYRKLGFEVTREFYYFNQINEKVEVKNGSSGNSYPLRKIEPEEVESLSGFRDFYPSWQNSFDSIRRDREGFICLGAFVGDTLVGYVVFEPVSGDITQIAVDPQYRRRGIGSLLIREVVERNKCHAVKVINTDISCDAITAFLNAMNIEAKGKQFEMIKVL